MLGKLVVPLQRLVLNGVLRAGKDFDEDITPSDVPADPPTIMQGPMTRARMHQLNLEVSSFLSDPFSYF